MKKTITKVISVILCAVMLAGTSALFGFVSAEEYFENSRFHVKSKAELTAMYNNKEKFVLYCFRKTCGNSQYIWTNVVTEWCDTYGKDIYGTDVDSIGIPNFVWNACEGESLNLPVIAFVDGDDVTVFTNTSGNTQLRSQIEEKFFDFYKIAPLEKENITYRYKVTFHQTEARTMLTAVNTLRLPENAWLWNETDTEQVFNRNLQPLVYDYDLERIAMQRAAETVARWKHQRPNGETPWSAYNVYGTCSENIAYGQKTAAEVENGWEEANEPYEGQGHRRNLLGENFRAIGIACAEFNGKRFWVQEFRDIVVDSAETPANDSLTEVSVEIAKEFIESKTLDSSGDRALTLNAGSSVNLPALNYKIKMNTDPCYEIPAAYDPKWTCANTSIATVSGNKITGVSAGETYISANTDEGEIIYTVKVNAATVDPGHVHEFDTNEIIQKPTCTEEGIIQYTCSSCGYVTTSKLSPLNPAGHSFTRYVDNGDGTETAKCDRCDVTDTREIGIPVHVHDWKVIRTAEPTCTEEGVTYYTCSCGEAKTETVPAKGHSFTNYVYNNDATETADGTETAKCDRCDATDTRVKPGTRLEPAVPTETDVPVTPTEPTQTEPIPAEPTPTEPTPTEPTPTEDNELIKAKSAAKAEIDKAVPADASEAV
ncbi:MAG: CAP domain-containing protein, partial [Clostridia bacterium]|nr:CAP domain-containing protein [Clostridia bacterium]